MNFKHIVCNFSIDTGTCMRMENVLKKKFLFARIYSQFV